MQGNFNSNDVASLGIAEEPFTKELIETWSLLNFKKQLSNFGKTPVWHNSLIRIHNKPIHYRNWSSVGIYFVSDLLEEDSQFLTLDFQGKVCDKSSLLQYHGVICVISNIKCKNYCPQMKGAKTDTKSLLSSVQAFCKLAYKSFLTQSASIPCKSHEGKMAGGMQLL